VGAGHLTAARAFSIASANERIHPGASGVVTVAKPGRYEYFCREHPWTIGQLIVE
jgi:plastocyanin